MTCCGLLIVFSAPSKGVPRPTRSRSCSQLMSGEILIGQIGQWKKKVKLRVLDKGEKEGRGGGGGGGGQKVEGEDGRRRG